MMLEKEDVNELRERTGLGYTLPIQPDQLFKNKAKERMAKINLSKI